METTQLRRITVYRIVRFTKVKRSSFTVKMIKRCSALSASLNTQMPSMKSCPAPIKVLLLFELTMVVLEMRRLVKDMLDEVDVIDKNNSVCEDLYTKLEQKVKKKFNEEVERLEKSFRRIIEQLEIQ